MIRYAIKVISVDDGKVLYVSIGTGLSMDPQDAHLYTDRDLAEKKLKTLSPVWFKADIIAVEVIGL